VAKAKEQRIIPVVLFDDDKTSKGWQKTLLSLFEKFFNLLLDNFMAQ